MFRGRGSFHRALFVLGATLYNSFCQKLVTANFLMEDLSRSMSFKLASYSRPLFIFRYIRRDNSLQKINVLPNCFRLDSNSGPLSSEGNRSPPSSTLFEPTNVPSLNPCRLGSVRLRRTRFRVFSLEFILFPFLSKVTFCVIYVS